MEPWSCRASKDVGNSRFRCHLIFENAQVPHGPYIRYFALKMQIDLRSSQMVFQSSEVCLSIFR